MDGLRGCLKKGALCGKGCPSLSSKGCHSHFTVGLLSNSGSQTSARELLNRPPKRMVVRACRNVMPFSEPQRTAIAILSRRDRSAQ